MLNVISNGVVLYFIAVLILLFVDESLSRFWRQEWWTPVNKYLRLMLVIGMWCMSALWAVQLVLYVMCSMQKAALFGVIGLVIGFVAGGQAAYRSIRFYSETMFSHGRTYIRDAIRDHFFI